MFVGYQSHGVGRMKNFGDLAEARKFCDHMIQAGADLTAILTMQDIYADLKDFKRNVCNMAEIIGGEQLSEEEMDGDKGERTLMPPERLFKDEHGMTYFVAVRMFDKKEGLFFFKNEDDAKTVKDEAIRGGGTAVLVGVKMDSDKRDEAYAALRWIARLTAGH